MFESVFYTVAPMVVIGFIAVPAALVLSICAGVQKYTEWRHGKGERMRMQRGFCIAIVDPVGSSG